MTHEIQFTHGIIGLSGWPVNHRRIKAYQMDGNELAHVGIPGGSIVVIDTSPEFAVNDYVVVYDPRLDRRRVIRGLGAGMVYIGRVLMAVKAMDGGAVE